MTTTAPYLSRPLPLPAVRLRPGDYVDAVGAGVFDELIDVELDGQDRVVLVFLDGATSHVPVPALVQTRVPTGDAGGQLATLMPTDRTARRQAMRFAETTAAHQRHAQALAVELGLQRDARRAAEQRVAELEALIAAELDTWRHLAFVDDLTGLPNRRAFRTCFATQPAIPVALAYLDLDGFKQVNDVCGHQAGNEVLIAVADRAQAALAGRGLLARVGGDEFAALLWDGHDPAAVVAELVTAVAGSPVRVAAGRTIRVSTSAGWVPIRNGDTYESAMERADRAMYADKHARAAS